MSSSDPKIAEQLRHARDELQLKLEQIDRLLERAPEAVADAAVPSAARSSRTVATAGERPSRRPVRAKLLDALDDVQWPMYTRQLARYVEARTGDRIQPARFGVLARDEMLSYDSRRARPVYLGFAITSTHGEAIKRLLVRSDWELARRIVAPTTGRVQHLTAAARLCQLALDLGDGVEQPDLLRYLAADHARDLPGVTVRHGRFELERWRQVAERELARVLPKDRRQREAAAARMAHRPEHALLFGVPETIEGDAVRPLRVAEADG
jgi:hypothetical protein